MTNFALANIAGPPDALLRARLYAPNGDTLTDLALVESDEGIFSGTTTLSPTPDNSISPYEYEVRQVSAQTSGAFNSSILSVIDRSIYGYLTTGVWYDSAANPFYVGGTTLAVLQNDDSPSSMGGTENTLVVFQSTQLVRSWQIQTASGGQYDLTGHTFEFLVHEFEANGIVFSLDSDQFALTPSDETHESILDVVTITVTPDQINSDLLGKYQYKLRDTTSDLVLATGTFLVKLAPTA